MQMGGFGNTNHDQKESGHFHGSDKDEMQHGIDMHGGDHYMLHDGGDRDQKHSKATYWNYGGQNHLPDSGGGLGDSQMHVPSINYKDGNGHVKHSTNHNSNIDHEELMSGGHTFALSGVRGDETGDGYNYLEQVHGHVLSGGMGGDHSHAHIGHVNLLSDNYAGELEGGHNITSHGYGQVLSGGHQEDTGGDQSHVDSGRDNVLGVSYEGDTGSGYGYADNGNDDLLRGDYGKSTGGGQSHMQYGDIYDSSGGIRVVTDSGQGNMKYVRDGSGYKVHENGSEDKETTYETHGFDDHTSMEIRYVMDPKDHVGQIVEINGVHDMDGKDHKHLHNYESFVISNSYGDVIKDIWYGSTNTKEKDHARFAHIFEQNYV